MSENRSMAGQISWYVVSANNDVVAGPLSDKAAADRLAESFGPDHVVQSGTALETDKMGPTDPI